VVLCLRRIDGESRWDRTRQQFAASSWSIDIQAANHKKPRSNCRITRENKQERSRAMKTRTILTVTTVIVLLSLLALAASQTQAVIIAGGGANWSSSPFGITFGQTARLNILNTSDRAIIINDFKFLDGDGSVLVGFGRQVIQPGKIISVDLNADAIARATNRLEIHAQINCASVEPPDPERRETPLEARPTNGMLASVEVINNADGRTTLFFQDRSIGDPNVRPNPSFAEPPEPESTTSDPDNSRKGM